MKVTQRSWFVPAVIGAVAVGVGGILVYVKRASLPWWQDQRPGGQPPTQQAGGNATGIPIPPLAGGGDSGAGMPPRQPPRPEVTPVARGTYIVLPGDTLSKIATSAATTPGKIGALNPGLAEVTAGQKITIPEPSPKGVGLGFLNRMFRGVQS